MHVHRAEDADRVRAAPAKPCRPLLGLLLVLLVTGCTPPAPSAPSTDVSLAQAKVAFTAIQDASTDASYITGGVTGMIPWTDNGTVGADLRRISANGTLAIEMNPSTYGAFPSTITYTLQGYVDAATGYAISGTMVYVGTSFSAGSATTSLSLSHPTEPVQRVTGSLTRSSYIVNGSYTFNGKDYTFADLTSP
jgi:hypothetical protein